MLLLKKLKNSGYCRSYESARQGYKKIPTLRQVNGLPFYEPSTRTRTSFELAGKYLSMDTVNIAVNTSSVAKVSV